MESRLDSRPKYKGMVVPFNVLVKDNIPHFKINDELKVIKCAKEDLCTICGQKLNEDKWLIGGPASAFANGGYYVDLPIHKECGIYALKTCPYMAYTQYQAKGEISERIKKEFPGVAFYNPTMDLTRLQYFVFVKLRSVHLKVSTKGFYLVKPERPYIEIEYWRDGIQLMYNEVMKINFEHKIYYNEFNY